MAHWDASDLYAHPALRASFLSALPPESLEKLLADAIRLDIPAGGVFYREGESPRLALVLGGLIRVYLTSPDGRQVTVRYARRGEVLGAPVAVGGPVDVSVQALVDSTLVMLNVRSLRDLAQNDARIAWAVAEEIARRLYAVLEAFSGTAFGTVRQRVARHLLDLAAERQHGAKLLAPVSQQELADAVGTVREVVARVLREARAAGLVETTRSGVLITDPAGLHDQVGSGE
jgi:CRP/FNR family transcriptional regulator, cyclic AMP receptor protein